MFCWEARGKSWQSFLSLLWKFPLCRKPRVHCWMAAIPAWSVAAPQWHGGGEATARNRRTSKQSPPCRAGTAHCPGACKKNPKSLLNTCPWSGCELELSQEPQGSRASRTLWGRAEMLSARWLGEGPPTEPAAGSRCGWAAPAPGASRPVHTFSVHTETRECVYIYTHTHVILRHLNIIYCQSCDFLNIWRMWYLGNRLPRVAQINYRVNQHIASAWERRAVGDATRPRPHPGWEHVGGTAPTAPAAPAPRCSRTPEHAAAASDWRSVILDGFFSWRVI